MAGDNKIAHRNVRLKEARWSSSVSQMVGTNHGALIMQVRRVRDDEGKLAPTVSYEGHACAGNAAYILANPKGPADLAPAMAKGRRDAC